MACRTQPCCIAVSSDNHTCVTSTDVNNHATLGIVCGAQVPKCEPARVASRRNVWGTRCERSDVSCETLCGSARALVKCVTKKQCGSLFATLALATNRRPSRGHPKPVTVRMAVPTRGYSGGGLCERTSRAVVPRAATASPPCSHGSMKRLSRAFPRPAPPLAPTGSLVSIMLSLQMPDALVDVARATDGQGG